MRVILRDALGAGGAGPDEPTAVHSGGSISLRIFTSHGERHKGDLPGTVCLAAT